MGTGTSMRRFAPIIGLCAALAAVPSSAGGQGTHGPDTPADVASKLGYQLFESLGRSPRGDETGRLVALQPLSPGNFSGLTARQRRQLYEWLLLGLGVAARGQYDMVDLARLPDTARALESTGDPDWWKRYLDVLKKASARINIVCTSVAREQDIFMSCSANDINDNVSLGRASALFALEWLNTPIALELAVGYIAEELAARLPGATLDTADKPHIVGPEGGGNSALSSHIAGLLEDAVAARIADPGRWRPVGGEGGEAPWRLEGTIELLEGDALVLRVAAHSGDRRLHVTRERIARASVPAALLESDSTPDPARIVLPEGYTVADWVLMAEDRLRDRDFARLVAEANALVRERGPFPGVEDIRERAISGMAEDIRPATAAEAPGALERIARIERAAGERPVLSRLKARAHRLTGNARAEEAALVEWLALAPQDHPERRETLRALSRARTLAEQAEVFAARLGRPFRAGWKDGTTGWTALHFAALLDLPAVVEALIETGAAPDARLKEDRTSFGDGLKRTLAGLHPREDWSGWRADGETPLMIAAFADSRAAAAALVTRGADVNAKSENGWTLLHYATLGDARETVEWLVGQGADIHAKAEDGMTPLNFAMERGAFEAVERFVRSGVYLNAEVSAEEEISPRHLRVVHATRIPRGGIRGYPMIARGCYSAARLPGDHLDWSGIAVCPSHARDGGSR